MGNNNPSRASKRVNLYREYVRETVQDDFKYLENTFARLNKSIETTRNEVTLRFSEIEQKLDAGLGNEESFKAEILKKRLSLLAQVEHCMNTNIYAEFRACKKSLNTLITDNFYRKNTNISVYHKIKYMKFINDFEAVDTNSLADDCYNYIIIPFSRHKIFYCLGLFYKKSFIKITNKKGQELHRRAINPNIYYKQFYVFGEHVAGLYEDNQTGNSLIEVYDDELKLISSRGFNFKFDEIVYLNRDEMVCKSSQTNYKYFFFNLNLQPTYSFRVLNNDQSGSIESEVALLGSDQNELYLYNVKRKFLKVLSRINGQSLGSISFESVNLGALSNLRLDQDLNLIFRLNSNSTLNFINFELNTLTESSSLSSLPNGFKNFDLTHLNDIYFNDNLNKKIYFL